MELLLVGSIFLTLLFLATLSDSFDNRYGGLDWRINDIRRPRSMQCYMATAGALAFLVPALTRNPIDAGFGIVVMALLLLHRWSGLGYTAYRRLALAIPVVFAIRISVGLVPPNYRMLVIFALALLWLLALSEKFGHRFGDFNIALKKVVGRRTAECYLLTAYALTLLVPTLTKSQLHLVLSVAIILVFLTVNRTGAGLVACRRLAIITLAVFAFSVVLVDFVVAGQAKSKGRAITPIRKLEIKKSVPHQSSERSQVA